jgi:integrase-like protein
MVKKPQIWIHPKGYHYVRKNGNYYRIHAEPGTQEYDAEYWQILTGRRASLKTSYKKLIENYRKSDRWTDLAPRTRADYEKVHEYLLEKAGNKDAKKTRRVDIITAMDANRHRVRFANYIQQTMNVLFEHAIDKGWVDQNPAKGIRLLKTPREKQRPHTPWPDWAVKNFRSECSQQARLILEMGIGSVQRPDDWTRFRWDDFDGTALLVIQQKTGKELYIPCTRHLLDALKIAPRAGETILTKRDGSPLPYRRMAQIMRDERKRLGVLAFDLHALRYRGIHELALHGCTDDEIGSYSGHTSSAMIKKYAGAARQLMRARQAHKKRQ